MPAAPEVPTPSAPKGWDIDKRQAIGIALGLLGLGLIIGFKMANGMPEVIERPVDRVIVKEGPCADCAEKAIKAQRAAAEAPQQSVPGDSSIPED